MSNSAQATKLWFPVRERPRYGIIGRLFALLSLVGERHIQRAMLALVVLMIPFPIDTHLWYRDDAAEFGSLGGLAISITTVLVPLLYMPLLIQRRRGGIHLSAALTVYLVASALSLFYARDQMLAVYEVALFLEMFLVYTYILNAITCWEDLQFVVKMLLLGLLLESLLMIAIALSGGSFRVPGVEARLDAESVGEFGRVGGSIGSPNDAAAYLSMALALGAAYLFVPASRGLRWVRTAAVAGAVIALVLTLSRGGWVATGISFVTVLLFARSRFRIPWKAPLAALLAILLIAGWFYEPVMARLSDDDRGAAQSRVPLMEIASLMIQSDWFFGVGANNFPVAMESYITRGFAGEFVYSVHNKFLLIWSETGLISLLAYLCFLGSAIRVGLRCWRKGHTIGAPIALGCVAAITGHLSHMLVDPFRGYTVTQLLWVLTAVTSVSYKLSVFPTSYHENRPGIV